MSISISISLLQYLHILSQISQISQYAISPKNDKA